ncbi:DUF6702 family protein [Rhodospirillum centenum]|uniref:Orphan protein, putative n=1 Tax=Rhodospirillum centenum (strain ATCC 51521 / SW) TaxID=414684 RepID=B6IQI7_RHOCS|nr:DUF6702 family protein [Rhodospirillum centenum]ACI97723.1 orphan protein, putative [Rhodospirillum centenum SW]
MLARRRLLSLALAGLGLAGVAGAPGPVLAHRAKAALTTIAWNPRSGTLEVVHRLHAHDAEIALNRVEKVAAPDLADLKTRAILALYVEKNFALADAAGAPLALTLVGAEVEMDHVYVYQELALPAPPAELAVRDTIMLDVFSDQLNQVNIDFSADGTGGVRTLMFRGTDDWKTAKRG